MSEPAPEIPAETVTPEEGIAGKAAPGWPLEWIRMHLPHLFPHLEAARVAAADATVKAASTTEAAKRQNEVLKELASILAEVVREGPLAVRAAAALEEAVKVGELLAAL